MALGSGWFFAAELPILSGQEREIIAERTRDVMRYKQQQGEYIGGHIPYGFQVVNGELAEAMHEQQVIQQVRSLHAQGLSLRKVSAALEQRSIQARTGAPFHPGQIQRMIAASPTAPTSE